MDLPEIATCETENATKCNVLCMRAWLQLNLPRHKHTARTNTRANKQNKRTCILSSPAL